MCTDGGEERTPAELSVRLLSMDVLILHGAAFDSLRVEKSGISGDMGQGWWVKAGLAILATSSGLTTLCLSWVAYSSLSMVLSAPAVSATLMWKSPTSAPWTGSCWALQPRLARRPSGSAALPSHLPSYLPVTMSGSSSTQMPPALARPKASASPTSEVILVAGQGRDITEHSVCGLPARVELFMASCSLRVSPDQSCQS